MNSVGTQEVSLCDQTWRVKNKERTTHIYWVLPKTEGKHTATSKLARQRYVYVNICFQATKGKKLKKKL